MKLDRILALVIGLVVGAVLVIFLWPTPEPTARLIDGKYLVVESEGGHWIYEKDEEGFVVKLKELSPAGLRAIWELQSQYMPHSIDTGQGVLVNVPATRYSTESGTFQVVHRFYRLEEDKLVEVKMEALPTE